MSGLTSVLIVTGIVIWQEYFAVYTAIEAQRVAALAHAFATVIIILIWIAHVYASIWISLHRASAGQPPAFRVRSAPI